jgi:hypothetical protein
MTVAELTIPHGWHEITPAWMTEAIRRHHPDAVVSDVAVVLRDDGTNRRARLELTYSAGSGPATGNLSPSPAVCSTNLGYLPRESFCRLIIRLFTPRSLTRKDPTS